MQTRNTVRLCDWFVCNSNRQHYMMAEPQTAKINIRKSGQVYILNDYFYVIAFLRSSKETHTNDSLFLLFGSVPFKMMNWDKNLNKSGTWKKIGRTCYSLTNWTRKQKEDKRSEEKKLIKSWKTGQFFFQRIFRLARSHLITLAVILTIYRWQNPKTVVSLLSSLSEFRMGIIFFGSSN
jgi:hypothetical protein